MSESTTLRPDVESEVRAYVSQVRRALSDLSPDELDDLTQGMEADLLDVAREPGGSLHIRLGTPETYAAELRSAAGLPPRVARTTNPLAGVSASLREQTQRALQRWPWLRDLRPVWWVARGFIVAWVLHGIGTETRLAYLSIIFVPLSFWLGKASSGWHGLQGAMVGILNVVTGILALPTLIWLLQTVSSGPIVTYVGSNPVPGLATDGNPVLNLYAYDQNGERIDRVRLFDQDGKPIRLAQDYLPSDGTEPVEGPIETFPHSIGDFDGWTGTHGTSGGPTYWMPPVAIVPLPTLVPTSSAGGPSTPTATPSAPSGAAPTQTAKTPASSSDGGPSSGN